MKIEAYWTWDARILGTGHTPAEDNHLTVIEGVICPGKVELAVKGDDFYKICNPNRLPPDGSIPPYASIPLYAGTDIRVHISLSNMTSPGVDDV